MKERKTVTREGLQFKVMSSRERVAELGGRHFYCIGRDADGWTLFEHDQDITVHGSATPLGRRFERLLDTKALVAEIRRLVETDEVLPADCRPPWEIDARRHDANQAALAEQRSGAGLSQPTRHPCGAPI
ncbi:hypothetical protein [Bordetella phage vB_BbrM_PHB04]|uniref:Uncharacterized protein n=1 Tax=Bordetella phage vB_BbrM_PHB04 TaxID=2029657 RepID=A0A291LAQ3_9CAUD|nr:hypothetical protein HOS14_gp078 [Bordetella phage vB_BbrM_PHB04]ATI15696.1 hypothetical protein [Bordetella phage vB_BbrM_PHB04]